MASESVNVRLSKLANGADRAELQAILAQIVNALQAVGAKLDADAGVTDTNYTATIASYVKS